MRSAVFAKEQSNSEQIKTICEFLEFDFCIIYFVLSEERSVNSPIEPVANLYLRLANTCDFANNDKLSCFKRFCNFGAIDCEPTFR